MIWAFYLTFRKAYLQKTPCQLVNQDFPKTQFGKTWCNGPINNRWAGFSRGLNGLGPFQLLELA
jgi:hypothetical protein